MIDSHCHLDFEAFADDRQQVIERAIAAGVGGILDPAIDLETSRNILRLCESQASMRAAVGVHPNSATTWTEDSLDRLRALANHAQVVAIGEIGLDYYRDRAPHALQQEVFKSQLLLAAEINLPVIVHTRNASSVDQQATLDALAILEDWRTRVIKTGSPLQDRPGVLHSYSGDAVSAKRAIDLGFCIGITGPVTFRNAPELQQTVSELPLERLLIETDAPFLAPHPHRGKRNEPAYIGLVADKIAFIHNQDAELVRQMTTANAQRLFNWRADH